MARETPDIEAYYNDCEAILSDLERILSDWAFVLDKGGTVYTAVDCADVISYMQPLKNTDSIQVFASEDPVRLQILHNLVREKLFFLLNEPPILLPAHVKELDKLQAELVATQVEYLREHERAFRQRQEQTKQSEEYGIISQAAADPGPVRGEIAEGKVTATVDALRSDGLYIAEALDENPISPSRRLRLIHDRGRILYGYSFCEQIGKQLGMDIIGEFLAGSPMYALARREWNEAFDGVRPEARNKDKTESRSNNETDAEAFAFLAFLNERLSGKNIRIRLLTQAETAHDAVDRAWGRPPRRRRLRIPSHEVKGQPRRLVSSRHHVYLLHSRTLRLFYRTFETPTRDDFDKLSGWRDTLSAFLKVVDGRSKDAPSGAGGSHGPSDAGLKNSKHYAEEELNSVQGLEKEWENLENLAVPDLLKESDRLKKEASAMDSQSSIPAFLATDAISNKLDRVRHEILMDIFGLMARATMASTLQHAGDRRKVRNNLSINAQRSGEPCSVTMRQYAAPVALEFYTPVAAKPSDRPGGSERVLYDIVEAPEQAATYEKYLAMSYLFAALDDWSTAETFAEMCRGYAGGAPSQPGHEGCYMLAVCHRKVMGLAFHTDRFDFEKTRLQLQAALELLNEASNIKAKYIKEGDGTVKPPTVPYGGPVDVRYLVEEMTVRFHVLRNLRTQPGFADSPAWIAEGPLARATAKQLDALLEEPEGAIFKRPYGEGLYGTAVNNLTYGATSNLDIFGRDLPTRYLKRLSDLFKNGDTPDTPANILDTLGWCEWVLNPQAKASALRKIERALTAPDIGGLRDEIQEHRRMITAGERPKFAFIPSF